MPISSAPSMVSNREDSPALVALGAGQSALLGPASVAVHDDRHVLRQALAGSAGGRAPDGCGDGGRNVGARRGVRRA